MIAALTSALADLRGEPVHGLVTTQEAGPLATGVVPDTLHQLVPGDTQGSVTRFLDHWRPDAAVIIGPPDRPLLIAETRKRDCPLFLAAARRGETAGGRLGLLPASLVNQFDMVLAPSAAEAEAFRKYLDRDRVVVTGPLSDTALALPCNEALRDRLAKALHGRPVWLAINVGDTEIEAVETAHRRALKAAHRLLLILVPATPEDGPRIAEDMETRGWRTGLRSKGDDPEDDVQVFIADLPGETGLWYRLAPMAYLGGTMTEGADPPPDPFEAAALGSAVIHGPWVGEAPWRFERLAAVSASRRIADAEGLATAVFELLAPDKAAAMAHAGWSATTESAHVVEALVERIDEALLARDAA